MAVSTEHTTDCMIPFSVGDVFYAIGLYFVLKHLFYFKRLRLRVTLVKTKWGGLGFCSLCFICSGVSP